ncbi:class I SAM-dependent methyltransferase [Agreia sp. VKM Ac-1783]|uniref:SAM-dependent methyltransferase n=1 Tax=Agreia sp. VKM Ac-1783 TaxID=1938889 RepID=UPI000A2AECD3|nr:class I SAM-dependent methyltransferase [Agreia sp. VKM Ac-1783]SMQ67917.1 Methyltransferase domain-containing protein [Agreia sp. VKM Ac-1783]
MTDHEQQSPASFWESRYRESDRAWSGRANAALEREAGGLTPGRALDLGSGEGGDALWLAYHGWSVTAVDISPTALERGRLTADSADLGDRISWIEADLATWIPDGEFDLVSAHFLHSPVELPREAILRRAASAVAPSGVLLIVGHGAFPPWSTHRHDGPPLPVPDDVLASLGLSMSDWTVVTSAMVDRDAVSPSGETVVMTDAVLALRRAVSV